MNPVFISRGKNVFFKKIFTFFCFLNPLDQLVYSFSAFYICTLIRVCLFFPVTGHFSVLYHRISIFIIHFSYIFSVSTAFMCTHFLECLYEAAKKGPFQPLFMHDPASCSPVVMLPLYLAKSFLFQLFILGIEAVDLFLQGIVSPGHVCCNFRILPDFRIGQCRLQCRSVRFCL